MSLYLTILLSCIVIYKSRGLQPKALSLTTGKGKKKSVGTYKLNLFNDIFLSFYSSQCHFTYGFFCCVTFSRCVVVLFFLLPTPLGELFPNWLAVLLFSQILYHTCHMYFFFFAWFSSWHLGQDLNLAFGMMDKKENNGKTNKTCKQGGRD